MGPHEVWPKLNTLVLLRWWLNNTDSARSSALSYLSADDAFLETCSQDFGVESTRCPAFLHAAVRSQDAIVHTCYTEAYAKRLNNQFLPTGNWLRDDRLVLRGVWSVCSTSIGLRDGSIFQLSLCAMSKDQGAYSPLVPSRVVWSSWSTSPSMATGPCFIPCMPWLYGAFQTNPPIRVLRYGNNTLQASIDEKYAAIEMWAEIKTNLTTVTQGNSRHVASR